ncbi:hypothetical protein ES288_A01G140400v1 [Gossypium darwinii]|uniref:Uncharacterized protein n=1 Tax=Gossypium darwinii TaxID=34276 RepID=A0A5D2HL84_GOSDA|nr:hypothetical protein ES288_A01G140400v1 [Gossypium darwinii]
MFLLHFFFSLVLFYFPSIFSLDLFYFPSIFFSLFFFIFLPFSSRSSR